MNHPFQLQLARSGRTLQVPADAAPPTCWPQAGIAVATKCSDGLCGVCATAYDAAASDAVEHRDVVLSAGRAASERVVLCCSRAKEAGGRLVVEL